MFWINVVWVVLFVGYWVMFAWTMVVVRRNGRLIDSNWELIMQNSVSFDQERHETVRRNCAEGLASNRKMGIRLGVACFVFVAATAGRLVARHYLVRPAAAPGVVEKPEAPKP